MRNYRIIEIRVEEIEHRVEAENSEEALAKFKGMTTRQFGSRKIINRRIKSMDFFRTEAVQIPKSVYSIEE